MVLLDPAQIQPEVVRPLRRVEYEHLTSLSTFENEHVELLYGVVIEMTPTKPPHSATVQRLMERLVTLLGARATVRVQSPFVAGDASEPEPDLAVVPRGDYDVEHPREAWLIVEVAESSLAKDRGVKATLYAECGVVEYWVINLIDRQIEVHTDVVRGVYTRVVPYRRGDQIRLLHHNDVEIAVDAILR